MKKLNEAHSNVIRVVQDYEVASMARGEGEIGGTDLSDVEAALAAFEAAIRKDDRTCKAGWETVSTGADEDTCRLPCPRGWLYRAREWNGDTVSVALQFVKGADDD